MVNHFSFLQALFLEQFLKGARWNSLFPRVCLRERRKYVWTSHRFLQDQMWQIFFLLLVFAQFLYQVTQLHKVSITVCHMGKCFTLSQKIVQIHWRESHWEHLCIPHTYRHKAQCIISISERTGTCVCTVSGHTISFDPVRHQWNSGVRHVLEVKYSSDWCTVQAVCVLSGGRITGLSFFPHVVSTQFPGNITEIRTNIRAGFFCLFVHFIQRALKEERPTRCSFQICLNVLS